MGDAYTSYVEGISVHHSNARVTTIHATHYLRYEHNVGYAAKGHNVFLEDGIEQHNFINHNLIVSAREAFFMLQTDITVACYWLTNPSNIVTNNRCAGGDFYGFWYELVEHPDGPSATEDVCPQGMAIEKFDNNKAHSMGRFGLRLFYLVNKKNPCGPPIDVDNEGDPWAANPSYLNEFTNFETFKNKECGLLSEYVGNTVYRNFKIADSWRAGA